MNNQISTLSLDELKQSLIKDLQERVDDKILEPSNFNLLQKLINNAENKTEAISIATLGTTYKRTGFHFDKRLEKQTDTIKYFKKNIDLSFVTAADKLTHKLIIGDNYDALLNLSISYKNKIDVIYIDPPYGKDDMGEFAHTNYDNAISRDNLLSMLYPRIILARELLTDEGVIFCSIDDKNQAYVKGLFDDVFGEYNFVTNFVWKSTPGSNTGTQIKTVTEYVICFSKNLPELSILNKPIEDENSYKFFDKHKSKRGGYKTNKLDRRMTGSHYSQSLNYPIKMEDGTELYPGGENYEQKNWNWRWSEDKVNWGINNDFIIREKNASGKWTVYFKQYLNVNNNDQLIARALPHINLLDFLYKTSSAQGTAEHLEIFNQKCFTYPKPIALLKYLVGLLPNKNSIILDFFAGSGTTGQAVLELNKEDEGNRQFILVTNNENSIAYDITYERLLRVMTGKTSEGKDDFKWITKNKSLGDNLDVYEIGEVANNNQTPNESPFEVIDETLYGLDKLTPEEKVKFVCENFAITQKSLGE